MNARTGGTCRSAQPPLQRLERRDAEPRVLREVAEATISSTASWSYACPSGKLRTQAPSVAMRSPTRSGITSADTAAEASTRLREVVRRRRARRVRRARIRLPRTRVARHVGRDARRARRATSRGRGDGLHPAEPVVDRLRQHVVVQPEERQAPEPVRPERLLRLQRSCRNSSRSSSRSSAAIEPASAPDDVPKIAADARPERRSPAAAGGSRAPSSRRSRRRPRGRHRHPAARSCPQGRFAGRVRSPLPRRAGAVCGTRGSAT